MKKKSVMKNSSNVSGVKTTQGAKMFPKIKRQIKNIIT